MSRDLTPSMRRSALIAALRDPTTWPEGFAWDFSNCRRCGIGLFIKMLDPGPYSQITAWDRVEYGLGLTQSQACTVFGRAYQIADSQVTPAMVADRLEQIHRELEAAK